MKKRFQPPADLGPPLKRHGRNGRAATPSKDLDTDVIASAFKFATDVELDLIGACLRRMDQKSRDGNPDAELYGRVLQCIAIRIHRECRKPVPAAHERGGKPGSRTYDHDEPAIYARLDKLVADMKVHGDG